MLQLLVYQLQAERIENAVCCVLYSRDALGKVSRDNLQLPAEDRVVCEWEFWNDSRATYTCQQGTQKVERPAMSPW